VAARRIARKDAREVAACAGAGRSARENHARIAAIAATFNARPKTRIAAAGESRR
jgi:hypothetical protein